MRNKNLILPIFALIVISLLFLPMISAAATDVLNSSSLKKWGNYSTTLNFSAQTTAQVGGAFANSFNVSLYCNRSGGPMSVTTGGDLIRVVTIKNSSVNQIVFENALVNIAGISGLTDGMVYNCSARSDNYTDQTWANTGTWSFSNITIDNTAPVCTASVPNTNIPSNGYQMITYSITDALSLVANSASVTGPTGFTTLTYTDATGTKQVNGGTLVGSWAFSSSGTDRAGNTCTGSQAYTSYNNNGGVATLSPAQSSAITGNAPNYKTIGIIVLVAVGLFFVLRKKK